MRAEFRGLSFRRARKIVQYPVLDDLTELLAEFSHSLRIEADIAAGLTLRRGKPELKMAA